MQDKLPILEYDPAPHSLIEPLTIFPPDPRMPEHCVLCFFDEVIKKLADSGEARLIRHLESTLGPQPVYEIKALGTRITLVHPGVGAPLAAITMEKLIATGCRKFIAAGGAGVLDKTTVLGHLIIPDSAVRDEGTSYHYMPPGRENQPTEKALNTIISGLDKRGIRYTKGKTWTSDAFFRETHEKVKQRKAEGCISVEMEASALFAVAAFRSVEFAQILYAADTVCHESGWDHRNWQKALCREDVLRLAAELCSEI